VDFRRIGGAPDRIFLNSFRHYGFRHYGFNGANRDMVQANGHIRRSFTQPAPFRATDEHLSSALPVRERANPTFVRLA
jgi:hypothetical protein